MSDEWDTLVADEDYELRRDAQYDYLEELADMADARESAARGEW